MSVIVDNFVKGNRNFDVDFAYTAMRSARVSVCALLIVCVSVLRVRIQCIYESE